MTDRAALRAQIQRGCQAYQARQDAADQALLADLLAALAGDGWTAAEIARRAVLEASGKPAAVWLVAECLDALRHPPALATPRDAGNGPPTGP